VYGHQSSLFILVVYGHQSSDPETDEVLFQRDMSNSQRYPLDYCLIKVNVLIYIQTILFVIKNVNLSGEWKLKNNIKLRTRDSIFRQKIQEFLSDLVK